jgi:hypothetical protein
MNILETIEHVAVLRHMGGAKNRKVFVKSRTYLPSQRHYVNTRAIKVRLVRIFLAGLDQVWRFVLKKCDIVHRGHFIGVVILFKIPVGKTFTFKYLTIIILSSTGYQLDKTNSIPDSSGHLSLRHRVKMVSRLYSASYKQATGITSS